VVDVSAAGHLVADGEYVRAFDLGKLPPTIVTDWAAPLLDGDLPLDWPSTSNRSTSGGPSCSWARAGTPWNSASRRQGAPWRSSRSLA